MDEDGVNDERALRVLLGVVLTAAIVGGVIDLMLDAPASWLSFHAVYEVLLIAAATITAYLLWRGWFSARRTLQQTRETLAQRETDRDAWRASAERVLAGLSSAIDARLAGWGLTTTEREIALLLLKGQSHKQIAYQTGRSERTVRQHAVAVYQKSGLGGRAELAAFFLEDLTLPAAPSSNE